MQCGLGLRKLGVKGSNERGGQEIPTKPRSHTTPRALTLTWRVSITNSTNAPYNTPAPFPLPSLGSRSHHDR